MKTTLMIALLAMLTACGGGGVGPEAPAVQPPAVVLPPAVVMPPPVIVCNIVDANGNQVIGNQGCPLPVTGG